MKIIQTNAEPQLPISIFGAVMGFAGLGRALLAGEKLFGYPSAISYYVSWVAVFLFLFLCVIFIRKGFDNWAGLKSDFTHPDRGCFFGTVPISLLLIASFLHSAFLWTSGAILMLSLAYFTIVSLLSIRREPHQFGPGMILPVVGVLNITLTGGFMPNAWVNQLNIFSFAIGSVLTVVFFTLIIMRLIYQQPLNKNDIPTLMIMTSPFGVCFLAYTNLHPDINLFAASLFGFGLFLFLILLPRVIYGCRAFNFSWWALGFPTAAITSTAVKYSIANAESVCIFIAGTMLIIASVLMVFLLVRTSIYMALAFQGFKTLNEGDIIVKRR